MNPEAELTELLAILERTHNRLRELTSDEVDAVILPSGGTHLLSRAQQELQQKTALLSSVLDALPAHIALLDKDGTILSVNEAWRRFAEANQADGDQVGVNYLDVCRRDPTARSVRIGLSALLDGETRQVFQWTYPCHSRDARRWFRLLAAPTEEGVVAMHIDITESWRATEELRRSQSRYRELFDLNPRPMWLTDLQTQRFVEVNRSATAQYGYSREEFLNLTPADILVDERRPGSALLGIEQHRLKDGRVILVETYRQLLEQQGQTRELVLAVDVSERIRSEIALEDSRSLLAMASGLSRMGAWTADLVTRQMHLSEEYRRLFGPSLGPTCSFDDAYATVHEEDRVSLGEMFERCARDGARYEQEFRFQTDDGGVVWARVFGEAVEDATGQVVEVRGATQDITSYHLVLEDLRTSEERFRVLAQATDDVIWDWDLERDEVWRNSNMLATFGYSQRDLEPDSDSWKTRIHPQELSRVTRSLEAFLKGDVGEHWTQEYRFRRGDGSYATVADRGSLIRDQKGRPVRMVGGMTDITARRQAEQRLAAQASLIDQATDAIIVHTLQGGVLFWSRGAQFLYGWSPAEAEGCYLNELLTTEATDLAQRTAEFGRLGEWSGELEQHDQQGQTLTVFARWTLLRDAFGQSEAILAIHTDITERKTMQKQLQRSQRLESLGTLAGGIAHDLNNVLAPIVMALELLDGEVVSEGGRGLLDTLRTSSRRGADLVRQILTFARGSGGARRAFDVLELVSELERLMRETFPRDLVVEVDVCDDPLWVLGDPTQLHQVLLNLCVNARDAMAEGGRLRLTVSRVTIEEVDSVPDDGSALGPHVRFTVEDNGTGIPPELQDKIFEPFFTTKDTGQGTGLGLSTAFTIVREHGGRMSFTSELGQGTTFEIDLPLVPPASEIAQLSVSPGERGQGEVVLFVDDEMPIRNLARKILERHGYQVVLAADGVEALAQYAAQANRIAAVITDMSMPVMDGPTLVRSLRTLDPPPPIIGCSGRGYSASMKELDLDVFLEKPYDYQVLIEALRDVLQRARRVDPQSTASPAGRRSNTVLVVDDDKVLLRLMQRVLRGEGYRVLTAGDATTALELLEQESVGCLLTDVHLPGFSGRDLQAQVRKRYPETPVVLVSGSVGEPGMLVKPFTIERLKVLVRQALGQQSPLDVR